MAARRATDEQIKANARARQYRWNAKNKERVAANQRAWALANPGKVKDIAKRCREKHKAKYSDKRHTPQKRAEAAERYRDWRRDNPEKHAAVRRRVRDDIQAFLNAKKLESGCVDCGFNKHPVALHFDHVRGKKYKDVARIYSMRLVLIEIEKCEVRCANCHHIRHFESHPRRQRELAPQTAEIK